MQYKTKYNQQYRIKATYVFKNPPSSGPPLHDNEQLSSSFMRRIALSKSEIQNCKIVYIEKKNKAKYNMV